MEKFKIHSSNIMKNYRKFSLVTLNLKIKVFLQEVLVWTLRPMAFLIAFYIEKSGMVIYKIDGSRIGHTCADTWINIAKKKKFSKGSRKVIYFISNKKTCNQFMKLLVIRELGDSILGEILYWNLKRTRYAKKILRPLMQEDSRDTDMATVSNIINPFSEEENRMGYMWLRRNGWRDEQKIVCLLSRDSAYLKNIHKVPGDYHEYRNSNIETFKKSVDWLIKERKAFVIRMGSEAKEPLVVDSKNSFIDYPFCESKSAFLDVWLMCNCSFLISTGTGHDIASVYSGIPAVTVNLLPLECAFSFGRCITMPKHLFWKKNGKELDMQEHLKNSYYHTKEYLESGIEIKSLSSDEILAAVSTAWGVYIEKREVSSSIVKETEIFKKEIANNHLHGRFNSEFFICMPDRCKP